MRNSWICLVMWCVTVAAAEPPKEVPFERLTRAELQSLVGAWNFEFETKAGWKGALTIRATTYTPEEVEAGCGTLRCDFEYGRVDQSRKGTNLELGDFAGVRRGDKTYLVRVESGNLDEKQIPPEAKPDGAGLAEFRIEKEMLFVDASRGVKEFFRPLEEVDLEWKDLRFARVKP